MARDSRSPRTTSSSMRPGGRPGASTRLRTGDGRATSAPSADEQVTQPIVERRLHIKGLTVTRRAVTLMVVLVVVALSYASTLQVYMSQRHEMAVAEQEIRDRTAQISELEAELARWDDPAYVKTQARERLGWVVPGETGFRVVDEDGNPIAGGVVIESENMLPVGEYPEMWWDRLWGSVEAADAPQRKVTIR